MVNWNEGEGAWGWVCPGASSLEREAISWNRAQSWDTVVEREWTPGPRTGFSRAGLTAFAAGLQRRKRVAASP